MAQSLRALAVLPENPSLFPSTHIVTTRITPGTGDPTLPQVRHTCDILTHTHINT